MIHLKMMLNWRSYYRRWHKEIIFKWYWRLLTFRTAFYVTCKYDSYVLKHIASLSYRLVFHSTVFLLYDVIIYFLQFFTWSNLVILPLCDTACQRNWIIKLKFSFLIKTLAVIVVNMSKTMLRHRTCVYHTKNKVSCWLLVTHSW